MNSSDDTGAALPWPLFQPSCYVQAPIRFNLTILNGYDWSRHDSTPDDVPDMFSDEILLVKRKPPADRRISAGSGPERGIQAVNVNQRKLTCAARLAERPSTPSDELKEVFTSKIG